MLGSDPDHPTGIVEVYAPVSGVITDQQITNPSGVQALTRAESVHDLRHVPCLDRLRRVRKQYGAGSSGRVCGHPSERLSGPNSEGADQQHLADAGSHHPHGQSAAGSGESRPDAPRDVRHRDVPRADNRRNARPFPRHAILHLHDREWVYTPTQNGRFRRVEVVAGNMLPGNMQEIMRGIEPGAQVVANALVFQNTVEQ